MRLFLACVLLLAALPAAAAPAPYRLDRVVERASAWEPRSSEAVTVRVAEDVGHGSERCLELVWSKSLGEIKDGVPTAPQVPSTWVRLPAGLDLSRYTRLSFSARIGGPRHGFLHVAVSPEPRLWGDGVRAVLANVPLDAGGWQRGQLSLFRTPAHELREMRWIGFASVNVGHQPDEPAWLKTWIDDLVLSADPAPRQRGWDVDGDRIAVSRLGFKPMHEKLALAHASLAGKRFELRDEVTAAVLHAGTFGLVESALGRHAVADFSALVEPGRYRVHSEGLRSLPFPIGDDANEHSLQLLGDWVHGMRCGQATHLHSACHLDDGLWLRPESVKSGPDRRLLPLAGGWHDAGDVRTYYSYSYEMGYRMLRARDAGRRADRDGDGTDDFLDSARWALSHAIRLVDPVSGELLDKIADLPDYRQGNYWSDNLRGTDDDRPVRVAGELPRHVGSLAASAGLFMRRAETPEDRRLAAAAVALAERRLAAWVKPPPAGRPTFPPRPKLDDRHGHELARIGLGALQLHLATGKDEHLRLARSCADAVVALQGETFLPAAIEPLGGDIYRWSAGNEDMDLPELFLAELLLELPEDRDAARWRASLVRVAEWWMKPTRRYWGPFSLPSALVPEKQLAENAVGVRVGDAEGRHGARWIVPTAGRQQLADTALALLRIGQALEDPELERLARRQLHWAFGHNPFSVAWVALHDEYSIEQMYSFSQGRMAGAVAGYGLGSTGVPGYARHSGAEPVTHAAAELLAAAAALGEPARFELSLEEGGAAWQGEVVVSWERTGRELVRVRSDAQGRLPELALDGGERYLLRAGGVSVPLAALSGRRVERVIDLGRRLELSGEPNEPAAQSRRFTVALTAVNRGTCPLTTTVRVEAAAVWPKQREWTLELAPGASETIDWPLHAKAEGRPWILSFSADGTDARLDLTGETPASR